jgi:hypothetical protein
LQEVDVSHELFKKKIREEGYCCPWAFCEGHKEWDTRYLAEDLELSVRSVNQWREKHRLNWIKCQNVADCMQLEMKANEPVVITIISTSDVKA